MSLVNLPFEIIAHICSFVYAADLVNLVRCCSYLHSSAYKTLAEHQRKLSILSSTDDTNRPRAISNLRHLFSEEAESEDAWLHREVVMRSYFPSYLPRDTGLQVIFEDGDVFDTNRATTGVGLTQQFWMSRLRHPRVDAFELFFTLALLRMPRLTRIQVSLHPSHGLVDHDRNRHQCTTYSFELLVEAIQRIWNQPLSTRKWPPGLQSLRSVEVKVDELFDFYSHGSPYSRSILPYLRWKDIEALIRLPALRRLVLHRHRRAAPDLFHRIDDDELEDGVLDVYLPESLIEELTMVGFRGCSNVVAFLVRIAKRLRKIVIDQRGGRDEISKVVRALREKHASSLETIILPSLVSDALSWCSTFCHLKYLTLSYVDIMASYRSHNRYTTSQGTSPSASRPGVDDFQLANRLPRTIELLVLIGGQQSSAVTSVRAVPLYNDIRDFLAIIISFVSTRGCAASHIDALSEVGHLRDICFGDMRVAVKPENKVVGKTMHQSLTKATEVLRLKLNKEIEKSQRLRDICNGSGVRLHITNLKSRKCDHSSLHPYLPWRPKTRQELIAEAEKASQDADTRVQDMLTELTNNIPRRYKP